MPHVNYSRAVIYICIYHIKILSLPHPPHRCIAAPLYVRYSRAHSVPITSILSPPHRCPVAPLHHCTDVRRVVSYLYAHSAIYSSPLYVRYSRAHSVRANCINLVNDLLSIVVVCDLPNWILEQVIEDTYNAVA